MVDELKPNQTTPGTLDYWKHQIDLGIKYRKAFSTHDRWGQFKKYYRHQFASPGDIGRNLPYNITYGAARTIIPSVYYRNPYVTVKPRKMGVSPMHAWIVGNVDNWLISETGIKDTMRRAALDAFLFGLSFIKIGYEEDISRALKPDEDVYVQTAESIKNGKELKPLNRTQYNMRIRDGMPWALRVSPEDTVVPWGTLALWNTSWIGHRVIRLMDDVKDDGALTTSGLSGSHMEKHDSKDEKKHSIYDDPANDLDYIEYYEVNDYKHGHTLVFAPTWKEWLLSPRVDDMQIEGLNWVCLNFADDPDFIYSVPEAAIIEPQQLEMNDVRLQAMYHRRITLLKFLIKKGVIADVENFMSGKVGPLIEVDGNPAEDVTIIQPHMPTELQLWVREIENDVRTSIGLSSNPQGEFAKGRKTATEVKQVAGGHNLRIGEKRDRMADALELVINKYNKLIFQRWTTERVSQVIGVDGARYWVKHSMKELEGDYNIDIDVESLSPSTKMLKRKEIFELLQVLSKVPGANIRPLIGELARDYGFMNVQQLLPEAPETAESPMGLDKFMGQQRGLEKSPETRQARTKQFMGRM